MAMIAIDSAATLIQCPEPDCLVDEAQLAAVAFLARYSGRTLDAYRQDLRGFFQRAVDVGLAVLEATRPHIGCEIGDAEWDGVPAPRPRFATHRTQLGTLGG
jgi:hypothetical protein